jgi:hypothetical protein
MANKRFTLRQAREMACAVEEASGSGDDERAHSLEDDLRKAVLEAIVDGSPRPKALARIALVTSHHEFRRDCA